MGKSSPKPPAPPDPVATANAQTASNKETAIANAQLNRINQVTPLGNLIYTSTPGADGTPQYTQTTTLSPDQQALFDSTNRISGGLAGLGEKQIANVAENIGKPLDFSKLESLKNRDMQRQIAPIQGLKNSIDSGGQIQDGIDTSRVGEYTRNVGYGNIQDRLDTSGVPGLVGGDALSGQMDRAQQAAYNQQKAFLDPQWQQQESDLKNSLVQQGVPQNSDAWNRAMGDLNRQRTFAYGNAQNAAIRTGNETQGQLFGQGLAANQNAFGQAVGSGNFANSAQSQGFGQAMGNAALNNSVATQEFQNALQQQQARNAAQGQRFGQNAEQARFGNQSAETMFNSGLASGQFANQANNMDFNQSQAARNQGLNELQLQQQNPLTILNALRTGAQPTTPNFSNTPQVNQAGTDVIGPINSNFQGQLNAYNGQIAQNNANTQGLVGLAGTAATFF